MASHLGFHLSNLWFQVILAIGIYCSATFFFFFLHEFVAGPISLMISLWQFVVAISC